MLPPSEFIVFSVVKILNVSKSVTEKSPLENCADCGIKSLLIQQMVHE